MTSRKQQPTVTPAVPAPPTEPPNGRSPRRTAIALAVIVTCQLMVALDGNIVNIALPKIQADLQFSSAGLAWVFSAYALAFGGLLLGGRAADILGRRRMFVIGLTVVILASLLGGIAPSPGLLIAARALQGVGFAFAAPAALSLLATTFKEGPERNRALGAFSMVAGLGITLGLILGGLLTMASWRQVFFVNIPIGLVTALLAKPYLAETERHPARFDIPGALTSTLGMTAVVYGFIHASTAGWGDTLTVASFVVGVVVLAAFGLIEARTVQPLLPLRVLAERVRTGAYLNFLLLLATMGGTYFLLSLFVQQALGFSPLVAGLAFLPMAAAQFTATRTAPKLIPKFGAKPVLTVGVVLMLADSVWLTRLTPSTGYALGLLAPLVFLGAGLGFAFVPLNITILAGLPRQDIGAASGLLQALQQVGLSLGVAILATIHESALLAGKPQATGIADAVIAAVAFAVVALLLCLLMIKQKQA
jgi:EmrB/QacA subfamily drug resistance transporter